MPHSEFGAPLEGLSPVDFAEPGPFFRMGRAPLVSTSSRQFLALTLTLPGSAG